MSSLQRFLAIPLALARLLIDLLLRLLFTLVPSVYEASPSQIIGDLFTSRTPRTPTLEEIAAAFEASSLPLLTRVVDSEDRIPRAEQKQLNEFCSDGDGGVFCLLGSPGSGKTALLGLVTQEAIESGTVTLGIRADILPTSAPLDSWGKRNMGEDITALDAVRVAASRSQKVLVVIDQLDALANTVDLRSERLNDVIEFITQCSSLPGVSVICSCRNFDFNHDARFSRLNANFIELTLPDWDDVVVQLERHEVDDVQSLPEPFREMLRTPQHLQIYLDRFSATGKTDPFGTYHLMLDDLWERAIRNDSERDVLYEIADYLIETEMLWAPRVEFEGYRSAIASLEAAQILQTEDRRVGFRHQTLLEHAKARLFTKSDKPLSDHVLKRPGSLMVRPTVWAALIYLRDARPEKYRTELGGLMAAGLSLHMRYLLIDFLGQISEPKDYEIAMLAQMLDDDGDRLRVLIAIRGNPGWFDALQTSHFPAVMQGPMNEQWPMIGVIIDAWDQAREKCLDLIERYWLPDSEKDQATWRVMREIGQWDERAARVARTIVGRGDNGSERLYWAESLVYAISIDKPRLAPRVFAEAITRHQATPDESEKHTGRSPLEVTQGWYDLRAVAEAAPVEFLREGWNWVVQVCEYHHRGYSPTVVNHYTGSCSSIDERPGRPEAPLLKAFCVAIDTVSEANPEEFLQITKQSWSSENAVVHRLLIRGLCSVVHSRPEAGLEYLGGDRRRFMLGTRVSRDQSDSIELIASIFPRLQNAGRQSLEQEILNWSMYRDGIEMDNDRVRWDREARLRLLNAIPADLRSQQISELVEAEKESLPDWSRERSGSRFGLVRQTPPMSKERMLTADNEEVLNAISASQESDVSSRKWLKVEGVWEEPGGAYAAGCEIAELAKEHTQRALEIIRVLVDKGQEDAAAEAIRSLSESILDDNEAFAFVRQLFALNPKTEELRSNLGYMLYHRCREPVGLPDDICEMLQTWLSMPWDPGESTEQSDSAQQNDEHAQSVLWSNANEILDTDRSFWPLLAITYGYLMRSPANTTQWLDAVEEHLQRDIAERTWATYCSELGWIGLDGCDISRGRGIVAELFRRFPPLKQRQEGVRLIASVSDLLDESFLGEFLDSLLAATSYMSRQAFGELLTLIALRDNNHDWAIDRLNAELESIGQDMPQAEAIAVGCAFAAVHLWDELPMRSKASNVLCRLIPHATGRLSQTIACVFWTQQDFSVEESTESLLQSIADHPDCLSGVEIRKLVAHMAGIVSHKRKLVLNVCQGILKTRPLGNGLFEAGPDLVKIAMTLQRFPETQTEGLSLLEDLLRLGLDDAFRVLRDIDIRPSEIAMRPPRKRRRRHLDSSA
ncbi:MAG: AAA family ATPase [Planctomycetota bacterium]|nr:MAG: AAA family ATPase [Planctomycetota bacterium]